MELTYRLNIEESLLSQIHEHGAQAYPEEGAGLLLGTDNESERSVAAIFPLTNLRENAARHNRFLLSPEDLLRGELRAEQLGLDVIGVFHSHPDHPNDPSTFDREWALPWYSYIITSVMQGRAVHSRSWRLLEDRTRFVEEEVRISQKAPSET